MNFPPQLLGLLGRAKRVTVLTGAGVSAESGVPTFRDARTGLWTNFDAEKLATPAGFLRNPRLVWEWYAAQRELMAKAQPNPAHVMLARWEGRVPRFTLITQNIDGLHQRAGSRTVVELHGNIMRTKCYEEDVVVTDWEETGEVPPRCPRCGGLLRPDVVWFEEMLPEGALALAGERSEDCDVFLSVGTSAAVYPAAELPFRALAHGVPVVEINPAATPLSGRADYVLTGPAGEVLPELAKNLPDVFAG